MLLLLFVAAFTPVSAQTGSVDQWIRTVTAGTQSWSTAGFWLKASQPLGPPVPSQAGDVASIVADIGATQTIKLNGTVTIGVLNLGDINGSSAYNIGELATTDVLSFDNSSWGGAFNLGGRAQLNKVMGGADTFADVLLSTDLAIYNRVAFTIAGSITDGGNTRTLLKRGTTNLTLTGINSYTGDTIIDTTGGTVFLNTTGGNAIVSPLIRLGNSSYDGSVSTALTLQRSDQIADTSVIRFDGGSGRNAFFRLASFNETLQGISDYTAQGVIENTASGPSTLTLNTNGNDYSYNGFLRNNGSGVLSVVKNDAGRLDLSGGNIIFTGGLTINAGTVKLSNIQVNSSNQNVFGSDITNNSALELSATSNWILSKVISGSGSVTKLGTAAVTMTANQTFTGALTVDGSNNGTGNAAGTLQLLTGGSISATTPAITLKNGGTLAMINSTNTSATGNTTSGSTTVTLPSTAGLVPGMAVSGPNIPAGATIAAVINGTQFALSSAATATASSQSFAFTIAGANLTDRLRDATPITMEGGGLRFENNGGGLTYTESVGALTLSSGLNTITAGRNGGTADATQSTLTIASLARSAGSTLNFQVPNVNTGAALGVGLTNQVKVTGGLTLDDGIVGGWATVGNEWATYGANGVTALPNSSYSQIIGGNTNTYAGGVSSITVTDATGITVGMGVTGSNNIQAGTTVTSVSGTTIGLSLPTQGAGGNSPVFGTFASNQNIKLSTVTASGTNTTINYWMPTGSVVNSVNIQDDGARTFNLNGREIVIGSGGILSSGANHSFGTNNANAGVVKALTSAGQAPGFNELVVTVGDSNGRTLNLFSQVSNNGATPLTLVKSGPGKLVLTPFTTANAYSGGTVVNSGSIEIKDGSNLGTNSTPNFLVLNGGAIELTNPTLPATTTVSIAATGTRAITIGTAGGRFELDQNEILNIASGVPVTGPGQLTIGAGDATGGTINLNGVLSVQGGLNMVAGRLNLNNAANTFNGPITMSGGTLVIPSTGSIPSGLDLTMSGGFFRIYDGGPGGSITIGALSGSSTNAVIDTFTTLSNPPADLPAQLIINQNTNTTFAGYIRDVFSSGGEKSRLSIAKTGSGILTLTNEESSFRGTVTLAGGALAVTKLSLYGSNSSIGFGDFTIVPNSAEGLLMSAGTSLIFQGSTPSVTDRAFTMGVGSEGAAIFANGTTPGASLEFVEYPGELVQFDTPDTGATLTLGGRNTGDNIFGLRLSDNGTGALSLVKTGPGTWILNNLNVSNDFTGATTIYDGRLVITGDGALGAKGPGGPPVNLVGGVLDLVNVAYTANAGQTEDLLMAGGRLDTSSGTSSWAGKIDIVANTTPNVNVGRDAQLTLGAIGGGGPLDKDNFGTLVLNGVNTFTGTTRVRDGTLVLDYSTSAGDNKLSNSSGLFLGGGRTGAVLQLKNTSATPVVEVVPGTTLDRGEHAITKDPGTVLGRAVIDLGAITRNTGALLDVESGGLAKTVTNNNATGLLGAWATVGHTSWAFKNETNNVTGFIEPVTNFVINNWVSTSSNTDEQSSNSQTDATTNTLRFNQASTPVTVTLSGTNTLQSGGILVTPTVNVVDQIQGGNLTIGPATTSGGELVIQQFSPTAGFVIGSTITNRTAAPAITNVGLQKLGPGALALTGANTYSGITTIAGGTLYANSITDGSLPSSIGAATFAAGNVVIGGGVLEFTGESAATNRSLTVKEFGALNIGDEDMTLTLAGDELVGGMGSIVGDNGTAEWEKAGAGTLRLLRRETSGGASGIQTLIVGDGKLLMEYGYSTTPATTAPPTPPNATDRIFNTSANLTMAGGKLELIGDDFVFNNAESFQRFTGLFTVAPGASEIQVTSRQSLNPLLTQATTLGIGNSTDVQEIVREVGGTVLFVENPNGGKVTLNLYTIGRDEAIVIPWATYWNKNNISQPGVNNFASIEPTDKTVVSADSKSLYSVKSNPFDWYNDGLEHISEQTGVPFGGATVASNSRIASLRFFNDTGAGTIALTDAIQTINTLTLTQGAILIGANVKNNQKTLTGGSLTSTYLPSSGQAELIIHNYDPNLAFRLESQIVNPTGLATLPKLNLTHTGTGTTSLFAANTYTGTTRVTGGVLKLENANALPGGVGTAGGTSALTLDGGQIGLTAASGDFTRGLGTGTTQVQWTSSGGFAAYGVNRNVNLGGAGAQVRWGTGGFVPSGDTLVLGANDADKLITFVNPIDLGVTDRLVRVENGSAAEDALISGELSGAGSLTKNGEGALRLTATNTMLGGVTLAEGTLYVPSPAVLGSGPLGVGTTGNTSANDAPSLVLESGSISNVLTVGNQNSAGISSIEVPDNVTLNGTVTLNKTGGLFLGPDAGKTLTVNSAVGGTGGFTLADGGTVTLNAANSYGSAASGAGTAIDGSTIIRNGTVQFNAATSLGDGTKAVELGDTMIAPVTVDRATTGASLTLVQGRFDPAGNGVVGSFNGIGAFYDVSRTLDSGTPYGVADVGKKILVKDELENPERNGVYEIVSVDATAGTMNLKRVDNNSFPLQALHIDYGTDVSIQNGTLNGGKTLFLAAKVDSADINADPFYWKTETSLNPNVSLLLTSPLTAPVTNPIDVNATNGSGTTTLGYASNVLHGTATLSGAITLQSQTAAAETKDLFLTAGGCSELILSGAVTDPDSLDKLNLIKTGTGTVTLSGANNYAGTTEVRAGVIKLNNATALGSGNLNINGGVVGLTTASGGLTRALGTGDGQIKWSDSGGFAAYGSNQTANVGASVTWGSGNFVPDTKLLVLGAPDATAKATLSSNINLGDSVRTVNVPNGPAAVEGELSGSLTTTGATGALVKTGEGALLLSGANSYSATLGTTLAQGTLQGTRLGSGSVFGTTGIAVGGTGTLTGDALKLELLGDTGGSPATYSVTNPITVGTQNSGGTTSIDATHGGVAAGTADVILGGTVTLGRRVFVGPDAGAILQVSGSGLLTGANGALTVVDGGTLRLNNAGNYGTSIVAPSGAAIDGATIIRNGTIEVTVANALGNGAAASTVELGDARINLATVDRASGGMALADCGAVFSAGSWSAVPVEFGGGNYTVADIGKRLLVKDETLNPERNGIYTISAVSGTDMTLVRALDFDATAEMVYGSTVQATNGPVPGQQYFMSAASVGTVNTSPVLWRDSAANPSVALLAGAAVTIANNIDLNATGSTGTTTLGAAPTLTNLGSTALTYSGTITMQSQNSGAESLTLDISSAAIQNTATGVTLNGAISVNAVGADTLQLRKVGTGVATLANAAGNTYNGGTLVNEGVLLVNNSTGSGTGTGTVTVSGAGTVLGGTGSISGATTINTGAILQPGTGVSDANTTFDSAIESLAFGSSLTLGSGSTAIFQLLNVTAGNYDQALVTGNLNVSNTALLKVVLATGFSLAAGNQFNLLDWGSLTSDGDLRDQIELPSLAQAPLGWDLSLLNSQGVIVYAPEPSRTILIVAALVTAGGFRRRRPSRSRRI
ncbi:MAG: autotransporter-associated beta strand repeat-containing protein [Verrucomicrobiaceae bacterium]|nr:autotransporter-associated beta strand repeat-containing protein [Verrucomicrobiaceae bacterium]